MGRAVELGAVRDAQRRLAQGVGQFLCVEGEAGIGKTTLLAAATELLASPKTAVSNAAAVETDRHRPLVADAAAAPGAAGRPATR